MKYCLMLEDGQYQDNNFALIVINASRCGNLDNLVVLKPNGSFHTDLDIEPKTVVIVDKYKNFLNRSMKLVKVQKEDIKESYLDYLNRHELDGTPKAIENKFTHDHASVAVVTEVKYENKKKSDWFKYNSDKNEITEITNMYFDIFDILHNSENDLIGYLADNGVHTFKAAVVLIKEYLYKFGYRLLFRNNEFLEWEMLCGGVENFDKDGVSDSIGKFWIIKDEERHFGTRTKKPLTLYAEKSGIGYIIGNQGKNIKRMVTTFNSGSKYWEIPYIKVLPIEERTTNNNVNELNDKCLKLLNKIFKEVKKNI